jgi:hypothetical protein
MSINKSLALLKRYQELITNNSTYYSDLWDLNPKIRVIIPNNLYYNKITSYNNQTINILYSYAKNTWVLRFLLDEIKKYIDNYIPHFISCNLNIQYPINYPFKPPKWHLESCSNSLYKKKNIENNLIEIIKLFNCVDHSPAVWSPATSISNDILSFMVTFQKFIEENEL